VFISIQSQIKVIGSKQTVSYNNHCHFKACADDNAPKMSIPCGVIGDANEYLQQLINALCIRPTIIMFINRSTRCTWSG
jgi:hypothetical protein